MINKDEHSWLILHLCELDVTETNSWTTAGQAKNKTESVNSFCDILLLLNIRKTVVKRGSEHIIETQNITHARTQTHKFKFQ